MKKNYILRTLLLVVALCGMTTSWGQTYKKITTLDELESGKTYVVTGDGATISNAMNTTNSSNVFGYTTIEIANDAIVTSDASIVWTITKEADGNYSIKNGEIYVGFKSTLTKNQAHIFDAYEDQSAWTISVTDGVFTVANKATTERILQYNNNSGQERFACYKGTQKNLNLYKLEESTAASADVKFEDGTNKLKFYTEGATFSSKATTASTATIAYSSSDEAVATIDSEGLVTLKGVGETTIKAEVEANDTYQAGVAVYTLTVKVLGETLPYTTDFKSGLGNWINYTVVGTTEWKSSNYGAQINAYQKGATEAYFVSPAFDTENVVLSFGTQLAYSEMPLQLYYSTDFDPQTMSAPSEATWTEITDQATWATSSETTESGEITLNSLTAPVRFAFKYTSTDTDAGRWTITSINVVEGESAGGDGGEDNGLKPIYERNDLVLNGKLSATESNAEAVPATEAGKILNADALTVAVEYTIDAETFASKSPMPFVAASSSSQSWLFASLQAHNRYGLSHNYKTNVFTGAITPNKDVDYSTFGENQKVVFVLSTSGLTIYLNNEQVASASGDFTFKGKLGGAADQLFIGAFKNGGDAGFTDSFQGTIHSIRFYDQALSEEQVKGLFGSNPVTPPATTYTVNVEADPADLAYELSYYANENDEEPTYINAGDAVPAGSEVWVVLYEASDNDIATVTWNDVAAERYTESFVFHTYTFVVNEEGTLKLAVESPAVDGYTIKIADAENGTVTVLSTNGETLYEGDVAVIPAGKQLFIMATPDIDYEVEEVLENDTPIALAGNGYYPTTVTQDATITVKFRKQNTSGGEEPGDVYEGKGVFTKVTSATEITTGEYVFVANGFAMSNEVSSNKMLGVTITDKLSTDGLTVTDPEVAHVWSITEDNGIYTIKNGENILGYNSGTNFTFNTTANETEAKDQWTLNAGYDTPLFQSVAATDRFILLKNGTTTSPETRFGPYSQTNINGNGYVNPILYKWNKGTDAIEEVEQVESLKVINGKGQLTILADETTDVVVYSITGAAVVNTTVEAGNTTFALPAGIYIVNGVKAIVF